MKILFPLFLALVFTSLLIGILIKLQEHLRWLLKKPSSDRWHVSATPSMGGVAMFVVYGFLLLLLEEMPREMGIVFLGSSIVFFTGLIDDITPLRPYMKLAAQIIASCLMVMMGVHVAFSGNPLIFFPLTVLWIVGITNAFNLLDNMDGLAGGIALISTFFLLILTNASPGILSPIALTMFVGVILGFLWNNFPKAKIFMGDCGSQWLGFSLACFTILDTWESASNLFLVLATPALVLAVPIFDTTLVTLLRKVHGRPMSQGGRDHSSHRLVALGLNEKKTVVLLWGLSIIFGLTALFARTYRIETTVLLICAVLLLALLVGLFMNEAKVYTQASDDETGRRGLLYRLSSSDIFPKRRILDLTVDTILIVSSYILAYFLRYDWNLNEFLMQQLGKTLPILVGVKVAVLLFSGFYEGLWNYISFESSVRLIKASLLASVSAVLVLLAFYRFEGFSRTLFFIDFAILVLLMLGMRSLFRGLRESVLAFPEHGLRLIVLGTGPASEYLLKEVRKNRQWNLRPILVLSNGNSQHRKTLMGIKISNHAKSLESLHDKIPFDRLVITDSDDLPISEEEARRFCEDRKIPYGKVVSLEETLLPKLIHLGVENPSS